MVTLTHTAAGDRAVTDQRTTKYRLAWRLRVSGPWRREAFDSREEAFDRFFYLLGRGAELHWRGLVSRR